MLIPLFLQYPPSLSTAHHKVSIILLSFLITPFISLPLLFPYSPHLLQVILSFQSLIYVFFSLQSNLLSFFPPPIFLIFSFALTHFFHFSNPLLYQFSPCHAPLPLFFPPHLFLPFPLSYSPFLSFPSPLLPPPFPSLFPSRPSPSSSLFLSLSPAQ